MVTITDFKMANCSTVPLFVFESQKFNQGTFHNLRPIPLDTKLGTAMVRVSWGVR